MTNCVSVNDSCFYKGTSFYRADTLALEAAIATHRHDKLVLGFYESKIGLSHTQCVESVLYKFTFNGINESRLQVHSTGSGRIQHLIEC